MASQLKLSKPWFAFLVVVVNAANVYLVPLVGQFLPTGDVPYIQGFLTVVLNGLVVLLLTEQGQAPAAQTPGPEGQQPQ